MIIILSAHLHHDVIDYYMIVRPILCTHTTYKIESSIKIILYNAASNMAISNISDTGAYTSDGI